MSIDYIVVQAGGKGTRLEHLTRNKPKALVPVNNLPMIFHLFKKFPEKKFLVIGDYKCDVLTRYLEAFAEVDYKVIDAHGKVGTCGGLNSVLEELPEDKAFMMIWCDLVLPERFHCDDYDSAKNYIGISGDFPCRWKYENGCFEEERSVEHGVAGLFVFKNKSMLKDVPESGEFVRWLSGKDIFFDEISLVNTNEYGLISEYKKIEKSKCRPFNRITIKENVIIKEGITEQGRQLGEREVAWYKMVMDKQFPNLPKIYSFQPLTLEKIQGNNIYEYTELSKEEKKKILVQLVECLKELHKIGTCKTDMASYQDAYLDKTIVRLEKVRKLVPFANDEYVIVNGKKCRNFFYHIDEVKTILEKYIPEEFVFLHGDCTFSNILMRDDGSPVLIDPRGYFGKTEFYGDIAYDWAKLYYSLVGNYDQFNLKRFDLRINETDVELSIESSGWEELEGDFFALVGEDVTKEQIKLIHAIIWLSLTTYAWEDYDSICGAFYNGLYYLEEIL